MLDLVALNNTAIQFQRLLGGAVKQRYITKTNEKPSVSYFTHGTSEMTRRHLSRRFPLARICQGRSPTIKNYQCAHGGGALLWKAQAVNDHHASLRQSFTCNGKQVAHFRKKKGITQKELANLSGYSERLVRKAEAGGSLNHHAIRDLAQALCHNGMEVHSEDLISSPEKMALELLEAFASHEAEMVEQIRYFLDPEVTVHCAGDPEKIPFAGEWRGIEGFDRWARTFFENLVRPEKDFYQPTVMAVGNRVVTWGQDLAHAPGMEYPPIWVTQRFEFQRGKLVVFENLFDTESGSKHIAEARAQGLLSP